MRRGRCPQRRCAGGAAGALALALHLAACTTPAPPAPIEDEALVVFAAASLRDVFIALARDFEETHPGLRVTFNFAGTQELRVQLEHGAVVDVFASADERHMDELLAAGRVSAPQTFARNEPVLVVSPEGRHLVRELADLPRAERIVLGAPEVPIGRYTQEILARAALRLGPDFPSRVQAKVVSRELSVRQVLAKVTLGEASAAVVYRTDALHAGDRVRIVPIPEAINVVTRYPIAVVADAAHVVSARRWVRHVLSPRGQAGLQRAGFLSPEPPAP